MTYLAATLYMNSLYQGQTPRIVLAGEGGVVDNAISGIGDYIYKTVKDIKERPFAGIMSFIGPSLLWTLGFPWLAGAYELAEVLGFDWVGFWDSLKNSVWEIVRGVIAPGSPKPTENEVHEELAKATAESLDRNMKDKVDEEGLAKLRDKVEGGGQMPKASGAESLSQLIKQAGLLGATARASRGILSKIFRRIIPWAITTALRSLGFVVAGGALAGAVGLPTGQKNHDAEKGEEQASKVRDPIFQYQVSKSADPSLYEFHSNDASSVWLETGSINDIGAILWSWINSAFPQLANEESKITNSGSFIQVENMFRNRNKLATGLQIYSVPKPFQRKIDIVSYIINGYLKTRGNDAPKTQ